MFWGWRMRDFSLIPGEIGRTAWIEHRADVMRR
jgi:hypothetical protein